MGCRRVSGQLLVVGCREWWCVVQLLTLSMDSMNAMAWLLRVFVRARIAVPGPRTIGSCREDPPNRARYLYANYLGLGT